MSFHVSGGHLYVFFGECLFRSSAHFFIRLFVFQILSGMNCVYFGNKTLVRCIICKYFLLFYELSFLSFFPFFFFFFRLVGSLFLKSDFSTDHWLWPLAAELTQWPNEDAIYFLRLQVWEGRGGLFFYFFSTIWKLAPSLLGATSKPTQRRFFLY